jgi:hypothetical protein
MFKIYFKSPNNIGRVASSFHRRQGYGGQIAEATEDRQADR